MSDNTRVGRFRQRPACAYICAADLSPNFPLKSILNPNQGDVNGIAKNTAIQQIKIQKGGKPQFFQFQINEFGRVAGTGGQPPSNFR